MLRSPLSRLLRPALATMLLAACAASSALADTSPGGTPVPLLWKVSDADNSLYLLGSFHLLRVEDYPLSREVDTAFADAEEVMFELPPEAMGSPELGMQMGQAAMRADGTGLDSELPPQTRQALTDWMQANAQALAGAHLSASMMQRFEPWFVALMVTMVEMRKAGLEPALGMDAILARRADLAGKPTAGLETAEQQIAFLDGMDRDEQLQFLQESLASAAEGTAAIEAMHAAWRAGDAEALWKGMALDMRAQFPKLYHRINVARNDAWLPELEGRLQRPGSDDVLVVVGALHLLGEDGVVEKLRAKGYEVERICSACAGR